MIAKNPNEKQETVVVIGHGMVGHRFCERLVQYDVDHRYRIVTFCEESRAAYDRVGLTSYFAHRNIERLMLANLDWYREHEIELHIGDRATHIDRQRHVVRSDKGKNIPYDHLVLATGSYPFVPAVPGIKARGVFVYRRIEDLEKIIAYGSQVKRAAVIGGGLLGLEAAKAAYDLGLETHVIEFASRLMPRQIDDAGSAILVRKIESLGVRIHLNKATKEVIVDGGVRGLLFADGEQLDVDMLIVSAGIRPRDELARECGVDVGERGGVLVNDALQTSDPAIYAIGEVALHRGMIYGLVAPGYDMADIVAANLCGNSARFVRADLSTKLKLMGIDVASFGDYELTSAIARPLVYEDPFRGVYKKLLFNPEGTRLFGGVLVGDASDYGNLLMHCRSDKPLPVSPGDLIFGKATTVGAGIASMDDSCQVCSCNNVTKGQICQAIREQQLTTVGQVKSCTKAGTGCGGCLPVVTDLLDQVLTAAGQTVNKNLCEHFAYTRQELFEIVKIKSIRTFADLVHSHGRGNGCEICKPAVASILASLWNDSILDRGHQTLQDTNDRFLANMQRGGLYSVVPRVPGGEITPERLIVLGRVAKKYGLYTKITGGQRIDLFGAKLQDLPNIWEELVTAGFESGHAYGKAVRTVKSCVGTTWCRYGVQDSVRLAIRVEERYRGVRAPHKIKMAVSGCIRECAEAQSKDVGLIATEKGYNLYVCGNGGSKPRHADLLEADLHEDTALKYLDRFLMYYIQSADRLTRTSVWLEKMEGGIDYLRDVIVHDRLGIAAELERQMQHLVDTYRCEWKEVVEDPEKRKWFRQFVNTDETEPCIEMVDDRGQLRPADWPKDVVPMAAVGLLDGTSLGELASTALMEGASETSGAALQEVTVGPRAPHQQSSWVRVGSVADFPIDGGATIKYGKCQIAVFNFASRGEWYACQNVCPHKKAFVLSRGILGDQAGVPKVACPLHKKTYSLESGECLTGDKLSLRVFPVKIDGNEVWLELPPQPDVDRELATELFCVHAGPLSTTCTLSPAMSAT